jgi:diguanylate cyclase (GGDEF)-like protein
MTAQQDLAVGSGPPRRPDRAPLLPNPSPTLNVNPQVATIDIGGIADRAALVGEARRRVRAQVDADDRRSGLLTGGSFLVAVAGWVWLAPPPELPFALFVLCAAAYIVAGSVEFEIGPGSALPATPVLVVMLFMLPPQLVPVAVVAGLAGAALINRWRDPQRRERLIVLAGSGWHAVGPAAVFAFAHVHRPALSDWPVYLLALLAQFTFDAISSWVRNCHGLGVDTKQLANALEFTFLCDLLLAPIGLAAALAVPRSPAALLLLLPPIGLLAMLQSDRRKQIDQTVALSAAYSDNHDLARRDVLTDLANRLTWEEATSRFERSDASFGVVFADVDGLKTANDRYGHEMGDRLLIAVAEVLIRETAGLSGVVVARIGGDEFALLLPDASPASTHSLASSLRARFREAATLEGVIPISASVGFGFAPNGRALAAAIAAADRGANIEKVSRGIRRR